MKKAVCLCVCFWMFVGSSCFGMEGGGTELKDVVIEVDGCNEEYEELKKTFFEPGKLERVFANVPPKDLIELRRAFDKKLDARLSDMFQRRKQFINDGGLEKILVYILLEDLLEFRLVCKRAKKSIDQYLLNGECNFEKLDYCYCGRKFDGCMIQHQEGSLADRVDHELLQEKLKTFWQKKRTSRRRNFRRRDECLVLVGGLVFVVFWCCIVPGIIVGIVFFVKESS